ncbi:hypothetical protein [Halomarina oriensis]|uniref:Uncharacterized protein n=1 Tax=Halomarina oriensis TaxID=671145 RepID=A0A6B0GU46_9EURY|nr:hypothetical protein [Halomarina oriensis]MWG35655.1 hypothetical protein [Halomarina oriensis]
MVVEREQYGVVSGVRADVAQLHEHWMAVVFPRVQQTHSVVGQWRPDGALKQGLFYVWGLFGALALLVTYPFLLFGFGTRFFVRRVDSTATRLGAIGVVALTAVAWGLLTAFVWVQETFSAEAFVAVAAASVVAVVSAGLAALFTRVGGRVTTVLLAYPAAMNALFLPPVVAALYSPTLAGAVLTGSESFAVWLLDNVLVVGDVNAFLRSQFSLEGGAYVAMWFAIAVPVGWLLGLLVTLADVVRPKPDSKSSNA